MLKKIKRVVEKTPNKIAYKVNDKSITYKELWNRANEYADLLKRQGTSPVILPLPIKKRVKRNKRLCG